MTNAIEQAARILRDKRTYVVDQEAYTTLKHAEEYLWEQATKKVAAARLVGGIQIVRERDIRRRGRPFNDMVECDPMHCACCGREIYKIAELANGDVIGSECACIIPDSAIMRMGRFLNKRQQEYARRHGLLA